MKKITIATLIIGLIAGIGLTSSLGNVENVHANPNMGGMTIEEARGVITDQVNKERKKAGKSLLFVQFH